MVHVIPYIACTPILLLFHQCRLDSMPMATQSGQVWWSPFLKKTCWNADYFSGVESRFLWATQIKTGKAIVVKTDNRPHNHDYVLWRVKLWARTWHGIPLVSLMSIGRCILRNDHENQKIKTHITRLRDVTANPGGTRCQTRSPRHDPLERQENLRSLCLTWNARNSLSTIWLKTT